VQKSLWITVAFLFVGIIAPSGAAGHEFIGLGNPGAVGSFVSTFLSADGTTVAGYNAGVGFRWTREEGLIPLGSLPGRSVSVEPRAVSADGSVIVGLGDSFLPFRWTRQTGPVALGFEGAAAGVSADGTIVVGAHRAGASISPGTSSPPEAVYWTQETGTVALGGFGPEFTSTIADAISSDGKVIVGFASYSGVSKAYRWTAEQGVELLGDLPASNNPRLSSDGAVIVGGNGGQAFRWSEAGGMIGLGTLPGTINSFSSAVSSDGSIVVGSGSNGDVTDPFVWDQNHGMRNLQDVLANDFGLAEVLADWDLRRVTMDATGSVFAGNGRHNGIPETWVLYLDTTIVGDPIPMPTINSWNLNANGNWFVASSWTSGVPNAVGRAALLGDVITQPRTLTLSFPVTLGRLDFDSTHSYTIAGNRPLTLDATTGAAKVNVVSGSHTISAAVTLADNTVFTVTPATSNLSITGPLNASGKTLTKAGAGTLTLNNLRAEALSISGGTLAIAAGGTSDSTSVLKTISIAGGAAPNARLDLNNNAAIIDHTGTSPAATVRQQIVAGRGGSGLGQAWNGNGITSSAVAAANAGEPESCSLAYAENAALPLGPFTTFRGQPVDGTALLIAYTRTGDANLDGLVNDDDVTIVGASYAPGVSQPSWALGDFDYNGFVDDDDVTLLGAFYDPTAQPLIAAAPSDSATVAAVPEPSTWMLLACVAVVMLLLKAYRTMAQVIVAPDAPNHAGGNKPAKIHTERAV
jgi:hypothetical protein